MSEVEGFRAAGGCFCGQVRFEVSRPPKETGYCHCRMCQRISGAPVLAWTNVPAEGFRFTRGKPKLLRSSSWGAREFCGDCGTPLSYHIAEAPKTIDINTACFDEPERFPPKAHGYFSSRISWFETRDDFPRHEQEIGQQN